MKIKFKLPKADLVLFDEVNKQIVIDSILRDFDYFILETRGKILIVNYYIIFQIIIHIFQIIKKKKFINKLREVKKLYFISIIDYVSPKVVLTYIDNDPYFHEICRVRKKIIGIAIQNGLRTHYNYHDITNNSYCIPYYFVHGNHAESVYKKYSHQFKKIFVVGSIKLDYFLSKQKIIEDKQFELCLISTWARGHEIVGDYPFSTENQYKAFLQIRDVVIKCGYSLVVALKSNQDDEIDFYRGIFDNHATYHIKGNDEFSSYNICYNSKIVLSTHSTLAFELFSVGKNVIFFNLSNDDRYTHSTENTITTSNQDNLMNLINKMLSSEPKFKYRSLEHIQCIHNEKPSFEVIRDFIKKAV